MAVRKRPVLLWLAAGAGYAFLYVPLIIVVVGVIVGFVAVALVSALYGIFNQVKLS